MDGTWQEIFRVSDPGGGDGDNFGCAVAIGVTSASSAPLYNNGDIVDAGAAYVYQRNDRDPDDPERDPDE